MAGSWEDRLASLTSRLLLRRPQSLYFRGAEGEPRVGDPQEAKRNKASRERKARAARLLHVYPVHSTNEPPRFYSGCRRGSGSLPARYNIDFMTPSRCLPGFPDPDVSPPVKERYGVAGPETTLRAHVRRSGTSEGRREKHGMQITFSPAWARDFS